MTYGVKLPDGRIIGFDEAVPPEQAQLIVRRDFPEAFQKKTGVGAEFSEGLASLIGGTKTALTAPFDSKQAARQGLLEQQARGAEFESGVSLDKLKQAYQDYGFLGGAGELTRQIPQAVAGMSPQIAASLGSAATGARLGAVAGLPGIVGGALGGFGASFLPIAGQNIARQAQEQEAAGQEIDPSLAKAYGAAAPAAALEVASLGFTIGKRLLGTVFGQTEKEIAEGIAKNATKYEADLVKAAEAKLLPTVAGGAARGLVEIPTEVAQQVLERAQAGLDLFSPDAISEYGEAAYQAGLVGPTVGGIASPINRAQARGQLEGLRGEQRAAKQREIRAEEEAYKASPEYIEELTARQAEIQEELGVLKNILKTKPTDAEDRDARSELKARKRDLDMEMGNIVSSLREVQPKATTLPLTSQQLVDRERNRLDEAATLNQLKATDSKAADEYANYIKAQDTYQAMQDKETQRLLNKEEKARQKQAKDIIDAYNKSVKGIEKTADAVTDEFGNIIPGLTKSGALAGRELTSDQRTKVSAYDTAVKELNDAVAAAGEISRQNLYDKAYVSDETKIDEIRQLQQNVQDRYQDIKDFAGERDIPQSNEVLDNLVTKLTEPPKEIPTELTPKQKEAEAKRVADLQKYKKNFDDAVAQYERLVQEAEAKAETPRVKGERGTELYADAEKGRSLEVLTKGKEIQDALDAQNKAKGELIEFLNQPSGEAVKPLESANVLQDVALLDLTDTVDSMRKGEFFGGPNDKMATGSLATKAKKARNELGRLTKIVINRINARRQANGLNKLSEKSTKEIEDALLELFGGKIERATGKLARVLKASGMFEGDTAMRQALEAVGFKFAAGRPTGEGEIKTGFSRAEFKDVKDFINNIEEQYSTKQREFGKLTRESTGDLFTEGRIKDTSKARKTEGEVDDVTKTARLLDKVLDSDLTAEQRTVFERAERMLGEGRRTKDVEAPTASGVMKFMPGLVDSIEAQGNRVLKGLEPDLKEISEAIKRVDEAFATPVQEGVRGSEEGFKRVPATQLDMFPGETATVRANRQNFLKLMSVKKRNGSAIVNAARKWLNGFKTTPPYAETAKTFFRAIVDLQSEVSKLTRERDQLDPKKVSDYIGKIKKYDEKIAAVRAKIPQAEKDFAYHNNRSQAYVVSQFAKLFNNKPITNLLKEAAALDAEGAKWISKSKNQGPDVVEEYRSWANQSFDLAETYRKEAYDIYADAEKDILKKVESVDKPDAMLQQFETLKKRVEKEVEDTLAKQKAKTKEANLPEYPERIRLLRLQNKMLDKAIKSTRERVAEEQAKAARQTGLNLPGIKSEIPVQPKGEAALPHRYDAVQTKFNFARQYYKEMIERRSVTMNKAQVKAYQDASAKYKESRTKLNQAFKENNVDPKIAAIMNSMVEMNDGTRQYRSLENNILGIEEQLQQKVIGFRAAAEKRPSGYKATTIKEIKGKETPEVVEKDAEIAKVLGRDEKPTPAEEFVGRISEAELADFRKAENDALEKAKKRLYGLSLQGEDKRAASEKERTALADEIKRLEKSIKATDIVLSARRVGMIVGQAQEEMGAKRFKPSKTEKAMTKAGKFEKVGIVPEYYATVAQSYRAREATAESALERRTPKYARDLAKRIVTLDERIAELPKKPAKETAEQEKVRVTEEKRLTDEVAFLRKEFAAAMARTKAETLATAFQQVMDINFRYREGASGGIDPAVAESFINRLSTKFGGKVGDKTIKINDNVKFIYAKSIADAPDAVINAAVATNKDLFKVRGAVLPDGTVVVIGAAHTDINDLQETIAHELIGHYAVDTVLGENGMKALVKKVFAGGDEGVYKLATELGVYGDVTEAFLAAKNSNMSKEQMQMLVTREMVAHVSERPIPSRASQAVKDFIKMVVNAVRSFFKANDFDKLSGATTQDIYNLIREATKQYESGKLGAYRTPDGNVAFFAPSSYSGAVNQNSIDTINKLYAKNKTLKDKFLANFSGLAANTQFLDRLAPAEAIVKKAENAGLIDATSALETTMYLRQTDQRLNLTAQSATKGVPELVMNKAGEMEVLGKEDGANLIKVGTILEKAKALGNAQAINNMFGAYLLHTRAKRVGIRTLSADLAVTKKELEDIDANIEAAGVMPIFKEAAEVYAQYNKDLINFAVQTGALTKEVGARLTKYNDYVPYYRVRDGIAELIIAGETPINIGRLTDQPYLNELVGGKEMIMNFEESAFQNTGVIVDLALRNLATSKLAQQLEKIKVAVRVNPKAKGTDIVRAKVNGVEAAWKIDTKGTPFEDIPADLLIKGLDGIKTQIPFAIKMLGLPSRWLRNMITRDPAYSARQIIKDSTAMWLYSGSDAKPIGAAALELGKMWTDKSEGAMELQRSGLLGGQVFTGMPEDMSKIMLQITSGKSGWQSLLAKLDRLAIQGDAATRVAMFNSFLKQGLSPMRAKLATLEALNVNKRGLSPTVYMLSTLVPFMSTQVQGLSVFAKAMTGRLDLAGQRDLRSKLVTRGLTMAVLTMVYAAAMQDDEAYKNADPFVKYNSWFVRVPWLNEPIRVPTPFEFGYVFKGLPEALYNLMFTDEKAKNVLKFFEQAAFNSVPVSIPQAIKPAIEATANFSFFTGESIESVREKGLLPGYRERPRTTELAKWASSLSKENVSPVMLDYLIKAYGGGLTLAIASGLNPLIAPTSDVAAPTKAPSQFPIVGGFFQPNDSSGVINAAYETVQRATQAKRAFDLIASKGNVEEARAFALKYANELTLESLAGSFTREMGEIAAAERAIRASKTMTSDEKADKIKQLRAVRIKLAEVVNKANRE